MADAVIQLYNLPADEPVLAGIPVEMPPRRALGDLAVPLAFELARRLRKAPRVIAQEIAGALGTIEGVSRIEAAPNGYVNFFLDRAAFLSARLTKPPAASAIVEGKTIVEHTAINPNKAAHIGHLRNAALGDSFGRLLVFSGRQVEIQNYIDDTGVQVADVAVGFQELERLSLDDVRRIADTTRFDFHCWDLYARVTEWYEEDKTRLKIRAAALHAIEHGGNPTADMAAFIADRIVRRHLETMRRMNIGYDLLTWEGDILRLHFWAHAFEFLKKTGAVFLQSEGRLKGCWVMKIDDDAEGGGPDDSDTAPDDSEDAEERREKVIVRSDGTVTYVGKDMAYQLWKFGLLGKDFHYRVFENGTWRPAALVDELEFVERGGVRVSAIVRSRVLGVQRHRHSSELPAEARQAGAGRARLRPAGGAFGPLRVRDGGALARHGARAWLRSERGCRPAVRRGVGPERPWRQGG